MNVDNARAVVAATNADGDDALAILTVREVASDVRVAATERGNVAKLRRAGADTVVPPAAIGGRVLVQSALSDDPDETLDELVESDGV